MSCYIKEVILRKSSDFLFSLVGKHLLENLETISSVLHLFSGFWKKYIASSFLSPRQQKSFSLFFLTFVLFFSNYKVTLRTRRTLHFSKTAQGRGHIYLGTFSSSIREHDTLTGALGWTLLLKYLRGRFSVCSHPGSPPSLYPALKGCRFLFRMGPFPCQSLSRCLLYEHLLWKRFREVERLFPNSRQSH